MKKPSYKRYEQPGLVEYLLKTKLTFKRGKAGRPSSGGWFTGLTIWDSLYSSWYGPGQDYDLCVNLALAFKHPSKRHREKAQDNVLKFIKQKAFKQGQRDFFQRLADAMEATRNVPFDPLGVAIKLAYKIHRTKSEADPTPTELVVIAERFFDIKNGKDKDFFSLRASLFRTAKKVLQMWGSD
jgi:hypothetical protein